MLPEWDRRRPRDRDDAVSVLNKARGIGGIRVGVIVPDVPPVFPNPPAVLAPKSPPPVFWVAPKPVLAGAPKPMAREDSSEPQCHRISSQGVSCSFQCLGLKMKEVNIPVLVVLAACWPKPPKPVFCCCWLFWPKPPPKPNPDMLVVYFVNAPVVRQQRSCEVFKVSCLE